MLKYYYYVGGSCTPATSFTPAPCNSSNNFFRCSLPLGVIFLRAIIKTSKLSLYFTPTWRFTQILGWSRYFFTYLFLRGICRATATKLLLIIVDKPLHFLQKSTYPFSVYLSLNSTSSFFFSEE